MYPRNRNDRNDAQNYNRDAGYESRFGSAGMKGQHRYAEFEPDTYGQPIRHADEPTSHRRPAHGDYSTFEGTSNRPYYGGEEGSFPYGGTGAEASGQRQSYNADERNYSGRRMMGEHSGKGPKGYRRSDDRIREEVCERLTEHGDIDASEIEVEVKDAVVALSGTVESRRMKRMVEDLAEQISGVMDVRNELRILGHDFGPAATSHSAKSLPAEPDATVQSRMKSASRSSNKDRASRSSRNKSSSSRQISQ